MKALVAGVLLSAVIWAVAPAAYAQGITNPAEHPYPVKVTIDGQTYGDGRDTLPGYDDELCTPIPNVQFDFAANEILYYDGDGELLATASWTEWSRISSYEVWLAQQKTPTPTPTKTPTPAPSTASTPTPAPSTPSAAAPSTSTPTTSTPSATTKRPATTVKPKRQTTQPKRTTTKRPAKQSRNDASPAPASTAEPVTRSTAATSDAPAASTTTDRTAADSTATDDAAATAPAGAPADVAAPAAAATPAGVPATAPAPAAVTAPPAATPETAQFKLASETLTTAAGMGDTRPAGIGILVALLALAGLSFAFRGFARR